MLSHHQHGVYVHALLLMLDGASARYVASKTGLSAGTLTAMRHGNRARKCRDEAWEIYSACRERQMRRKLNEATPEAGVGRADRDGLAKDQAMKALEVPKPT